MTYYFSAASLVGDRPNNEDALSLSYPRVIHVCPPSPLPVLGKVEVDKYSTFFCALADGMGGHAKGEVASQTAVLEALQNLHLFPLPLLKRSMERLHRTVRAASFGSGTTLAVAAFDLRTGTGLVASVGDTRAYLYRGGTLRQLCSDHNEAGAAARCGLPPGRRNVLLQCVGGQEDPPDVELAAFTLRPGDMLLLATDGAYDPPGDDGIREVLEGWWCRPRNVAQDLCARAVASAGPGADNATAVAVARAHVGAPPVAADFDDVRTLASPWS